MTYYLHTDECKLPEEFNILSIDPGITSLAICIEKWKEKKYVSCLYLSIFDCGPASKDISIITRDITKKLDEHLDIIKKCSIFIVERQSMGMKMIRVGAHILSYLTMLRQGVVIELSPKLRLVGKKRGEKAKPWVIERTLKLLRERNDGTLEIVTSQKYKQKEDMCDCIFQCKRFLEIYM
uniref:Holliday junction resolvase n=1 Tax=Pithovirus LCPAC403 TaxID=2506596 RepID=A0A481ZES5_9VIRU|nr:MAG: holliday junction resolvase [Pithovirus LCPAC403]